MQNITNTIFSTSEQLAQLHDFLHFKAQAYHEDQPSLSANLERCAALAAEASRTLIADIKYTLESHQAPMASKVKKIPTPKGSALKCVEQLCGAFPKEGIPAIELILRETPERLASLHASVLRYTQDKRSEIELLLDQKDTTEFYLAAVLRTDA